MLFGDSVLIALSNVFSWPGILIPLLGTALAMLASFLPGLGNASVAVIALMLSANWDPVSVMLLFGALTGGATFMGSITAILFNIPGSVASTAALLDGYPMGRKGLPKTAIACAATASAVGSVFGVILLLVLLPIVRPYILAFGPVEIFLIGVLGLFTVVTMPTTSRMKSALMLILGLLAAMVGSDPSTGQQRWSMGILEISLGLSVIPVMLGIYTIGELLHWTNQYEVDNSPAREGHGSDSTLRGIREVFSHLGLTFRSSWIGSLVGMVPGIGGSVAGFVAYGHAVQSSSTGKEDFGKGDVRGLIAPEAAIDAKDGGSLLPTLALGLPGSEACIILLAAFAMHGLVPGVPMLTTHLALSYTLIFALLFSNLLTSVIGVALAPSLAKLASFRVDRLALPSLLICIVSAIEFGGHFVDLYTMLFLGIAGYYWRRHGWPVTPFAIAFVLGKMIESNLSISVQLISLGRIVPTDRMLSLALVFLIVVFAARVLIKRQKVASPKDEDHNLFMSIMPFAVSASMLYFSVSAMHAYSWYSIVMTVIATAMSGGYAFYCWQHQISVGFSHFFGDMTPHTGHGRLLLILSLIGPCTWLLGLSATMALTTVTWTCFARRHNQAKLLASLVPAIVVGFLAEWLTQDHVNLLLSRGWIWMQFFS